MGVPGRCAAPPTRAPWRGLAPIARRQAPRPRNSAAPAPRRAAPLRASAEGQGGGAPANVVVIEADGVLMDVHGEGHRVAFNRAFVAAGYECAQWVPQIYYDLLRRGDGTGPGLIRTYYNSMGWPRMMATSDRALFVENVYAAKQRILREMAAKGEVPLRPGAAEFVDAALAGGASLVVVAGTASAAADSLVSSAIWNLGPGRASRLQVLTVGSGAGGEEGGEEGSGAPAGPTGVDAGGLSLSLEGPGSLSLEQAMAEARASAKQSAATEFARAMNLQGRGMGVDPALLAARARVGLVPPQFLAAVCTTLGGSAAGSAVLAANHSLMQAAKTAGLLVAGVPPSLAARGGYSAVDVSFDGFGPGGGVTWPKLKALLDARTAK